ncbi:hypothetical protein CSKR_100355 [Clonorchis sinensis]|uniref:Uncharacterized protein n=2 Tax=Clonorchis sinensis TaxID=79923 RepID=G7YD42_CLOSI|nr:hypothetical protein CSKR_100355 [Clonorchis sinensis]GAA50876.1 hypothetical protein CLF_105167 [Clonorchis sinensis]
MPASVHTIEAFYDTVMYEVNSAHLNILVYSYPPRLALIDREAASIERLKWLPTSSARQCRFSVRKPSREMPYVLSPLGKQPSEEISPRKDRLAQNATFVDSLRSQYQKRKWRSVLNDRPSCDIVGFTTLWCIRKTGSNLLILGVSAQIENSSGDPFRPGFCTARHKCSSTQRRTDEFSPTVDETSAIHLQSSANTPLWHPSYPYFATPSFTPATTNYVLDPIGLLATFQASVC